eukprot:scaffold106535_cov60-Attheya_sp.AAC.2
MFWANQSQAHPRARGTVDSTRVGPNPWDKIPGLCNTLAITCSCIYPPAPSNCLGPSPNHPCPIEPLPEIDSLVATIRKHHPFGIFRVVMYGIVSSTRGCSMGSCACDLARIP